MSVRPLPHPGRGLHRLALTVCVCIGFAQSMAAAPASPQPARALTELSLEELLNVEITSAARRAQRLADTAAAVFVITQDDIRRSGATSVPEALRMAPGLHVARFGASKWAISARGENGRFANKLLVLMDGRSIYTPLYSGVLWEAHDTMLENIERIEVIRGPGAAMWGANAVNGVINIITRAASDRQGTLVTAHAGTQERSGLAVRHGGRLGDDGHFRAFFKAFDVDHFVDTAGQPNPDSMRGGRAGVRLDRSVASGRWTLSGELHSESVGDWATIPTLAAPFRETRLIRGQTSGAHLLTRWERGGADGSQLAVQGYLDHARIDVPLLLAETRTTIDLDLQHRLAPAGRHDLLWGVGIRLSTDRLTNRGTIAPTDPRDTQHLVSAFVQDDIRLVPDRLRLTLAARIEHNAYTGFELQPTARLLWTPSPAQSFWTALSRAVRTPSRAEQGLRVDQATVAPATAQNPGPLPALTGLVTTPGGFASEEVTAFELGARRQVSGTLSVDLAAFANRYRRLREIAAGAPVVETTPLPPHLFIPINVVNGLAASSKGLEAAFDWRPAKGLRLQPAYTYLRFDPASTAPGSNGAALAGNHPRHQLSLRASADLGERQQVDLWLRRVDDLPSIAVPGYTTLDLRWAWRPTRTAEVALVGQNLLDRRQLEWVSDQIALGTSQNARGFYVKGRIEF